jgi:hypothetical protein
MSAISIAKHPIVDKYKQCTEYALAVCERQCTGSVC